MKPQASIIGIGILAATYYALFKRKKPTAPIEDSPDAITPITADINQNLVLKIGSKGKEVVVLQSLLAVSTDGTFGKITESKLYKLKGVKQITLKQFLSSPTINQFILKIGTPVMARIKTGTPIYNAIAKADTSYYSDYKIVKKIEYGQEVGKIRGVNPAGNWYTVYYSDFPFGQKVGFVQASDVEKI